MFQDLSNKKVVIIGASSGIGLATARKTAELGAHVVMSSRSIDKLNQAMASVSGQVEAIAADILNETSVNALFEQIGKFDHLVVTAVADENLLRHPWQKCQQKWLNAGWKNSGERSLPSVRR